MEEFQEVEDKVLYSLCERRIVCYLLQLMRQNSIRSQDSNGSLEGVRTNSSEERPSSWTFHLLKESK